jgi:hypothetical protein
MLGAQSVAMAGVAPKVTAAARAEKTFFMLLVTFTFSIDAINQKIDLHWTLLLQERTQEFPGIGLPVDQRTEQGWHHRMHEQQQMN